MTERRVKDGKFHIMEQALLMSIHHFAFSSFRSAASTSGGLGPPATAEQHLLFASYRFQDGLWRWGGGDHPSRNP